MQGRSHPVAAAIEQLEQGGADVHHLGDVGEIWGRYGGDIGEILGRYRGLTLALTLALALALTLTLATCSAV